MKGKDIREGRTMEEKSNPDKKKRHAAVEMRELQLACVHETAHATVVRLYGGVANGRVWKNPSQSLTESAWLGTCAIWVIPGVIRYSSKQRNALGLLPLPKHWKAIVGMAGLCGEYLFRGDDEHLAFVEYLDSAIAVGQVSATDLELIGTNWSFRQADETEDVLRRNWSAVLRDAESLRIDATTPT